MIFWWVRSYVWERGTKLILKCLTWITGKRSDHPLEMGKLLQVEHDLESRYKFNLHIMHLVMLERQSLALGREDWTGDECGSGWQKIQQVLRLEEITQRASVDRIALWHSPPGVLSGISCPQETTQKKPGKRILSQGFLEAGNLSVLPMWPECLESPRVSHSSVMQVTQPLGMTSGQMRRVKRCTFPFYKLSLYDEAISAWIIIQVVNTLELSPVCWNTWRTNTHLK